MKRTAIRLSRCLFMPPRAKTSRRAYTEGVISMADLEYYPEEDVLYLFFAPGPEVASRELHPNITAEFGSGGTLLGIEILKATATLVALLQPRLDAPDPEAELMASAQEALGGTRRP